MDVREKLVELLKEISYDRKLNWYDLWDMREAVEIIADLLIANGVTVQENTEITDELLKQLRNAPLTVLNEEPTIEFVQEWISVKDRLPEDMVDVLTCDAKGNIHVMWHHHDFMHPFNVGRNDLRYYPVTHWMTLPQPPKGE